MIKPLDFALGFDSGYTKDFVNRRCINLYRNMANSPSLSDAQLVGVPGVVEFADTGENICRGMFTTVGRAFTVQGNTLYEIFSYGGRTSRGTISTSPEGEYTAVRFASNGLQIAIITDADSYFFDLTNNDLNQITNEVFTGYAPFLDVTYKDGYFFYINDTIILQGSLVTDIDGTDYILANSATNTITSWVSVATDISTDGVNLTIANTLATSGSAFYPITGLTPATNYVITFGFVPTATSQSVDINIQASDYSYLYTARYSQAGTYTINITTPTAITSVNFIATVVSASIDDSIILSFLNYASSVSEGTGFNALNFAQAESNPDGNTGLITSNNTVYVFGENTIQPFQTVANTGFVLQPIQGSIIQKGCISKNTVTTFQGVITFLGGDTVESVGLYMLSGSEYQKITTDSIEYYINSLTREQIALATCWSYISNGGAFLVLDVGDASFVYDAVNSKKAGANIWHERQSGEIDWNDFKLFDSIYSTPAYGKVLVGSRTGSKVGYIDYNTFTEYGEKIAKGFTTQPFDADAIRLNEVKAFVNSGERDYSSTFETINFEYSSVYPHGTTLQTALTLSNDNRVASGAVADKSSDDGCMLFSRKLYAIGNKETGMGFSFDFDGTTNYTTDIYFTPFGVYGQELSGYVHFKFDYDFTTDDITATISTSTDGFATDTYVFSNYDSEEIFISIQRNGAYVDAKVYEGIGRSPVCTAPLDGTISENLYCYMFVSQVGPV